MPGKYRYCISSSTDPYENLATEELLTKSATAQPAVIFLWQNDHTIVIGRNQDVTRECRAEDFIQTGGRIARRRSGGGAVYHDMGNLNVSLICEQSEISRYSLTDLIIGALGACSVCASTSGRNDIIVGDGKCCGIASYSINGAVCSHACIMVDTDIGIMSKFLTPSQEKLSRHCVDSVASRVVNLSAVSDEINVNRLRDALIDISVADYMTLDSALDRKESQKLTRYYSSYEWVYEGLFPYPAY